MVGRPHYRHQISKNLNTTILPDVKIKERLLAICHYFSVKDWRKPIFHHLASAFAQRRLVRHFCVPNCERLKVALFTKSKKLVFVRPGLAAAMSL